MDSKFAELPAVHRLLTAIELHPSLAKWGATMTRNAVRQALDEARQQIVQGQQGPPRAALIQRALAILSKQSNPYPEVLNATGVLVHTNLGRAPRLSPHAGGYLALEYDLEEGGRGERLGPVVDRLTRYFSSEAATVVTNNAAALVLLLATQACGREVLVSRGELVEIGGSFRLPEIMATAGARLVEVGCTNRTRVEDYERAINENTAGILVVHRSNFYQVGFVATPQIGHLVELGHRRGIPVWVDQGSGCHCDLAAYGLQRETTVQEILATGADAVLFSGDKLLGGPQAGIIVGNLTAVSPFRRHPLRRALRPDKSVLVSLAATLDAYLTGRIEDVPLYRLLAVEESSLHQRARHLASKLRKSGIAVDVVGTKAVIGGGTTPDQTLPSWAIALPGGSSTAAALRQTTPPVIARIEDDRVLIDLRAVFPEQDQVLLTALLSALTPERS